MNGSEKQVAWAIEIREALEATIETEENAKYWIDRRN